MKLHVHVCIPLNLESSVLSTGNDSVWLPPTNKLISSVCKRLFSFEVLYCSK